MSKSRINFRPPLREVPIPSANVPIVYMGLNVWDRRLQEHYELGWMLVEIEPATGCAVAAYQTIDGERAYAKRTKSN